MTIGFYRWWEIEQNHTFKLKVIQHWKKHNFLSMALMWNMTSASFGLVWQARTKTHINHQGLCRKESYCCTVSLKTSSDNQPATANESSTTIWIMPLIWLEQKSKEICGQKNLTMWITQRTDDLWTKKVSIDFYKWETTHIDDSASRIRQRRWLHQGKVPADPLWLSTKCILTSFMFALV